MKKFLFLLLAVCLFAAAPDTAAKRTKELSGERQEAITSSNNKLNDKAIKAARDEAKRLAKEGWKVAPGADPLEMQLERAYLMQYEVNSDMSPKYILGDAMSVSGNYDAAHMQAIELAKQSLAGQIQSEVTALIENTIANIQFDTEEAESLARSVIASKNLISQNIGHTDVVVDAYRTLPNGNKEVMVKLAFSAEQTLNQTKEAIHNELKK